MKTSHVRFLSPDGQTIAFAHFGYSDRAITDRAREILDSEGVDFVEINRVDANAQTTVTWYVS